eukprot:scaffold1154_cov310-Pinguiococcus_pyrenoidosus.AAC.35
MQVVSRFGCENVPSVPMLRRFQFGFCIFQLVLQRLDSFQHHAVPDVGLDPTGERRRGDADPRDGRVLEAALVLL